MREICSNIRGKYHIYRRLENILGVVTLHAGSGALDFSLDYSNCTVTGMTTGRESYSAVAMVTAVRRREGERAYWFAKSTV